MPRERLFVNEVRAVTLDALATLVTEINEQLARVEARLDEREGLDGRLPKLSNDMDVNAHSLLNVSRLTLTREARFSPIVDVPEIQVTEPADTPASVDALRDDLVANTLPDIQEALDDLRLRVNVANERLRRLS